MLEADPRKEQRREAQLCLGRRVAVRVPRCVGTGGLRQAPQVGGQARVSGQREQLPRSAGAGVERWAGGVVAVTVRQCRLGARV